jgi:hypothetical protein
MIYCASETWDQTQATGGKPANAVTVFPVFFPMSGSVITNVSVPLTADATDCVYDVVAAMRLVR